MGAADVVEFSFGLGDDEEGGFEFVDDEGDGCGEDAGADGGGVLGDETGDEGEEG